MQAMIIKDKRTTEELKALFKNEFNLYEIYTCNETEVEYFGELKQAGEVTGWEIKWILAKAGTITSYPFFDCIITKNDNSTGRARNAEIFEVKP